MKQKLTITVDAELLPVVKRYALTRRVAVVAGRAVSQGDGERGHAILRFSMARQVSGGGA